MTPYRLALWEHLHAAAGELHVITLAMGEKNRKWTLPSTFAFKHHCLHSRGVFVPALDGALYWGGGIAACLAEIAPTHVLMDGYAQLPYISAIFWARRAGVPVVQWYRSHAQSSRFQRGPVAWLRQFLLKRADGWAVPGTLTMNYLIGMGIESKKIVLAPNAVETALYGAVKVPARGGPMRLLYVGQLIDRKGVDILLRAFMMLAQGNAILRIVGSGSQDGELRTMASARPDVEFVGPTRTSAETSAHYGWADVVAMPSLREVWGLVVNEALAAGCFVLSSKHAAATVDLVDLAPLRVGVSVDPLAGPAALRDVLSETAGAIHVIRDARPQIRAWGIKFSDRNTASCLFQALRSASC
jgi:glycosyltransferase involved in cell wall biosynthesis